MNARRAFPGADDFPPGRLKLLDKSFYAFHIGC